MQDGTCVRLDAGVGKRLAECLVESCGVLDGQWANKCLQTSLLSLLRDEEAELAGNMLCDACANSAPSGGCTSKLAKRNSQHVQRVLHRLNAYVWVVASDTPSALARGCVLGRWSFGDRRGRCVGALA
eukprot:12384611-Karenia_brevis.AAC.1